MSGQNVSLRRMSDVQKISLYSLCIPTEWVHGEGEGQKPKQTNKKPWI